MRGGLIVLFGASCVELGQDLGHSLAGDVTGWALTIVGAGLIFRGASRRAAAIRSTQ